jgi:hypothetical protein
MACVFAPLVKLPVLLEVATATQRAKLQDGFGAVEAPARSGDVHAVLDQMAARALDHACRDRELLPRGIGGSRGGRGT